MIIEKKVAKDSKAKILEQKRKNAEIRVSEKGKGKQAVKAKKNLSKNKAFKIGVSNEKASDDCECLYCSERYSMSKESWIMCDACKKWSHEKCTDYIAEQMCLYAIFVAK